MQYVLIHIHEGTIISSWLFNSLEAVQAFEAEHKSDDGTPRHLPDGTFDDPGSDTWVLVEGFGIELVDGEKPDEEYA